MTAARSWANGCRPARRPRLDDLTNYPTFSMIAIAAAGFLTLPPEMT